MLLKNEKANTQKKTQPLGVTSDTLSLVSQTREERVCFCLRTVIQVAPPASAELCSLCWRE